MAAGLSGGNVFFNPTVQAVIPALTTERQRLAANSVAWSTGRLVQILASGVAGGLIGLIGTGPAFAANAASFVASALLAILTPLPAALLVLFVYGLNTSTGFVVFNTLDQGAVPDAVRGRVFTLLDVTWSAMRLVSLALGGLLADALGVQPVFWVGGALLALAGTVGLLLVPRNMEAPGHG